MKASFFLWSYSPTFFGCSIKGRAFPCYSYYGSQSHGLSTFIDLLLVCGHSPQCYLCHCCQLGVFGSTYMVLPLSWPINSLVSFFCPQRHVFNLPATTQHHDYNLDSGHITNVWVSKPQFEASYSFTIPTTPFFSWITLVHWLNTEFSFYFLILL